MSHSATAEIQVIIFKFDRPILPYCPLHTRADSPADARLGDAEVKWRDERIHKHTLRVALPSFHGHPIGRCAISKSRIGSLGHGANRPVRGYPLARSMGQHG